MAHSPEIAGLFAFDSVGLRISGAPSLSVFGQGRVLHDQIPSLKQDIGVEAALTLDLVNTTLSGSMSLLQPADGSPPIPNLFGIDGLNILEGNGEFGINFATTPLPLPTIGFDLVAELPDFAVDTLSLPRTIGAALNVSTTEPVLAASVLGWRPFHVLGVDNIVIDAGSVVAAPNGGSIGTKVFPRGFSAAFEADILGTHVSYLGVFDQATQGIVLNGSVTTTRIARIEVGGPGCDGIVQDGVDNGTPQQPDPDADNGACFTATFTATNPLDNGLGVDFTIDLPGPGGSDTLNGGSGVNLIDGRLEVRGTDKPEQITIFRDLQTEQRCIDLPFGGRTCVTVTTVDDIVVQSTSGAAPAVTLGRVPTDRVTSLDVDARGGNDRIEINSNVTVPTILRGGASHDAIQGGGGIDSAVGDTGIDLLIGDPGDMLDGGPGDDATFGQVGNDVITCGGGSDQLDGGPGVNEIHCGNRPPLVGDSNDDGVFDSADLVLAFQAGEYEDQTVGNSTFDEGDWNGDGEFDSADLVLAFQAGLYERSGQPSRTAMAAAVDWLLAQERDDELGRSFDAY